MLKNKLKKVKKKKITFDCRQMDDGRSAMEIAHLRLWPM